MSLKNKIQNNKIAEQSSKFLNHMQSRVEEAKRNYQYRDAKKYTIADSNSGTYYNDIVFQRLKMATDSEISELCDALKVDYYPSIPIGYLSKEYRQAAGHSMANITRSSHSLPYKRILIDVADKLKPGVRWTNYKMDDHFTEEEIEDKIIEFMTKRFEKQFHKLSEENKKIVEDSLRQELKKDGVKQTTINATIAALSSGGLGAALAGTAASTIFAETALVGTLANILAGTGTGLVAVHVAPTASQVILCGTGVGVAIAIPLLAATLGGPAYRKTIPATIKMIAIRKRYESAALSMVKN